MATTQAQNQRPMCLFCSGCVAPNPANHVCTAANGQWESVLRRLYRRKKKKKKKQKKFGCRFQCATIAQRFNTSFILLDGLRHLWLLLLFLCGHLRFSMAIIRISFFPPLRSLPFAWFPSPSLRSAPDTMRGSAHSFILRPRIHLLLIST